MKGKGLAAMTAATVLFLATTVGCEDRSAEQLMQSEAQIHRLLMEKQLKALNRALDQSWSLSERLKRERPDCDVFQSKINAAQKVALDSYRLMIDRKNILSDLRSAVDVRLSAAEVEQLSAAALCTARTVNLSAELVLDRDTNNWSGMPVCSSRVREDYPTWSGLSTSPLKYRFEDALTKQEAVVVEMVDVLASDLRERKNCGPAPGAQ
ncbi:MAG: hypothetical protein ABIJ46_00095 [bacterium]